MNNHELDPTPAKEDKHRFEDAQETPSPKLEINKHEIDQPPFVLKSLCGCFGNDVCHIEHHLPPRTADIEGLGQHRLTSIEIGSAAGVAETDKGPVICIMHQYADVGEGSTIHSPAQMEHFGHDVDDKSAIVGGKMRIKTHKGYIIPPFHCEWPSLQEDASSH